jgi:hypothetical protein
MTNIAAKSKFTKGFCWNDESWDWQGMEDRKLKMIDTKIKLFGPRLIKDYISVINEDFGQGIKKDD